ncbi:MAG: hypothetical protein GWO41_17400 [candidate division Zixibacteria bacterium]|nr:hypothetical protein [Phycisphaerae bacterium]NIT54469.1 hypothetical protein [candidate division Zixibacteria bacterium]
MDKKDNNNAEATRSRAGRNLLRVSTVTDEMWAFLEDYAVENGLTTRSAAAKFILTAAMKVWLKKRKQHQGRLSSE